MTKHAVEKSDPITLYALQKFFGEDASKELDDALDLLPNGAPVFAWLDSLRLEGDCSSKELLASCPRFEALGRHPPGSNFTIFIRGEVEESGHLRVVQYHDVYVHGNVRARSILSHTGNLLATGQITADEVIAFECNEEGGLFHGASCYVPLLCHLGGGDWAVRNQTGKTVHGEIRDDPEFVELQEALASLGVDSSPSNAFYGVRSLVASGRSNELLRTLGLEPSA